ncbi:MAG: 6-phosphogluconolactonase [Deltaproteobacteria bacterium]|nr:6-phosphogluconolactonase [Deltaproteobacteria bacterium]
MKMLIGRDPADTARRAAAWVAGRVKLALNARGTFTVALAGGEGPRALYTHLAALGGALEPSRWEVFWGDERVVPLNDARSNYGTGTALLTRPLGMADEKVHALAPPGLSAEAAAEASGRVLSERVGAPAVFDLVLLGVGKDGHTLSLYPGCPALAESARDVVALVNPPMDPAVDRVTFTPGVVHRARAVLVLAAGGAKTGPLAGVLARAGDLSAVPARVVRSATGEVLLALDEAAAAGLSAQALRDGTLSEVRVWSAHEATLGTLVRAWDELETARGQCSLEAFEAEVSVLARQLLALRATLWDENASLQAVGDEALTSYARVEENQRMIKHCTVLLGEMNATLGRTSLPSP